MLINLLGANWSTYYLHMEVSITLNVTINKMEALIALWFNILDVVPYLNSIMYLC